MENGPKCVGRLAFIARAEAAKRTGKTRVQRDGRELGRRPLWVIAGSTTGWADVLCVGSGSGGITLPLFSFREEAELFLGSLEDGDTGEWRAKQTTPGELVSILLVPCADVARVALDPLPMSEGGGMTLDLVSMSREHFARMLLGEGEERQASGREHASRLAEVVVIRDYVMWDIGLEKRPPKLMS